MVRRLEDGRSAGQEEVLDRNITVGQEDGRGATQEEMRVHNRYRQKGAGQEGGRMQKREVAEIPF